MRYIFHRAQPEKTSLFPRQKQALEFIRDHVRRCGDWPSSQAIADHMGWKSARGASDILHRLRLRGHVRQRLVDGSLKWELVP